MKNYGEDLEGDEVVSILNQAKYLYLRHISEPEDKSLRLIVEEAIAPNLIFSTTFPAKRQATLNQSCTTR
jgi:hypothetical protein